MENSVDLKKKVFIAFFSKVITKILVIKNSKYHFKRFY